MIGVIGLGAMGLGIAQVFAQAGHAVYATDASPGVRATAPERLAAALRPRVEKGAMTAAARDEVLERLTVVEEPQALSPAELVIEAVIEQLDVKQAVLSAVGGSGVLATNTSSLSVGAIAAGLPDPARLIGLHFFNPAPAMKLVELVPHAGTAPAATDLARRLTEAAGKIVIPAPDRPGFIVNRCARPFYGEALAMLEEGRGAAEIDAAMTAAGYRMGPFALIDLIGADINLAATVSLHAAMDGHPRYHVFATLQAQVDRGHLGRKTGQGFVTPPALCAPPPDAAAIVTRIEAVLTNEAAWLLSDGGTTAQGIDTALQLGLNFPRGPLAADRAGVAQTLAALSAAAPPPLRGRYAPAPGLAP